MVEVSRTDECGTSYPLSYVLSLGTMAILLMALIGGGLLAINEHSYNSVTEPRVKEASQQVGRGIEAVDRLVRQSEGGGPIAQNINLPDRFGGNDYTIRVLSSADAGSDSRCSGSNRPGGAANVGCLIVSVSGGVTDRTVVSYYATNGSVTVESTTVNSGEIQIIREPGAGNTITVKSAD